MQWFDEIFKSKWMGENEYIKKWKKSKFRIWQKWILEERTWRLTWAWHVEETIFFKAFVLVNKPLLVSSRFVCATVIQVNNRSRYAAASLYVIVSTTSQFVNDELIIKMWMANMSTSYYLISDRLRLHTEWVFPSVCKGEVKYFLHYYYHLLNFLQLLHSE